MIKPHTISAFFALFLTGVFKSFVYIMLINNFLRAYPLLILSKSVNIMKN